MRMPGTIISAEWYSEALGRPTKINAYLPPSLTNGVYDENHRYKTVYMLPGALNSSDVLFTDMDITSSLAQLKIDDVIVFMVTPTFSNYSDYKKDYKYAHQYYTYVTKEIIEMTRTLFPLSEKREDTAIYGFSMGGWGAYYCGVNNPDVYGYVAAQSGMLDMQWAVDNRPFMTIKHKRQFGDGLKLEKTEYDLYYLTSILNEKAGKGDCQIPKFYQSWGGEKDYLNIPNIHMNVHMKALKNLDYTSYELDCIHSWGNHNEGVNLFFKWFLEDKMKGGDA